MAFGVGIPPQDFQWLRLATPVEDCGNATGRLHTPFFLLSSHLRPLLVINHLSSIHPQSANTSLFPSPLPPPFPLTPPCLPPSHVLPQSLGLISSHSSDRASSPLVRSLRILLQTFISPPFRLSFLLGSLIDPKTNWLLPLH